MHAPHLRSPESVRTPQRERSKCHQHRCQRSSRAKAAQLLKLHSVAGVGDSCECCNAASREQDAARCLQHSKNQHAVTTVKPPPTLTPALRHMLSPSSTSCHMQPRQTITNLQASHSIAKAPRVCGVPLTRTVMCTARREVATASRDPLNRPAVNLKALDRLRALLVWFPTSRDAGAAKTCVWAASPVKATVLRPGCSWCDCRGRVSKQLRRTTRSASVRYTCRASEARVWGLGEGKGALVEWGMRPCMSGGTEGCKHMMERGHSRHQSQGEGALHSPPLPQTACTTWGCRLQDPGNQRPCMSTWSDGSGSPSRCPLQRRSADQQLPRRPPQVRTSRKPGRHDDWTAHPRPTCPSLFAPHPSDPHQSPQQPAHQVLHNPLLGVGRAPCVRPRRRW
jgi:hypothetical protein